MLNRPAQLAVSGSDGMQPAVNGSRVDFSFRHRRRCKAVALRRVAPDFLPSAGIQCQKRLAACRQATRIHPGDKDPLTITCQGMGDQMGCGCVFPGELSPFQIQRNDQPIPGRHTVVVAGNHRVVQRLTERLAKMVAPDLRAGAGIRRRTLPPACRAGGLIQDEGIALGAEDVHGWDYWLVME
jgi:hypothetical protein